MSEPESITIYHNPRCSKSRATLALLKAYAATTGAQVDIVEYLKEPPDVALLETLLSKLGIDAGALVRRKEAAFAQAGLSAQSSAAQILEAMAQAPVLIERPIVVRGARAVLGRPPENVNALLDD